MNEPTHLDLFSGIGGFSLAFESEGFRTTGFVEFSETKRIVLREWFPEKPIYGDIREFDCAEFCRAHGRPDVVTGGVPCQPASALGLQRGTADERWLWPEAIRVVRETGPGHFVFENPPSLIDLECGRAWNGIVSGLAALGYDLWWDVFPAAAFGAGHLRERVLLVGSHATRIAERIAANKADAKPDGWDARAIASGASDFKDAANTDSERWKEIRRGVSIREPGEYNFRTEPSADNRKTIASNTNGQGIQRHAGHGAESEGWPEARRPIAPPDLRGRVSCDNWWHEAVTGIPVLVDGLPSRLVEAASLCAGDSIVPQVVTPIARAIYEQIKYGH